MKHELSRIQETASEARIVVGAIALKCIKRKAKSESDWRTQLKASLQTPSPEYKGGVSIMAYAEKQVNWKIILEGFLFMEHELNRIQEIASEARGLVESPQALAGESCGAINVVNDRNSLPTARRAGASQTGLWVKSYRACSLLIGSSGGA